MKATTARKTKVKAGKLALVPPAANRIDDMPFALLKEPREVQVDAVRRVRAAFDEGFEVVVLEGPPGCHGCAGLET